ncbi:hypothetical protein Javan623_0029 [Streptococcus phage Javan623]|uniref:hypothetical protein n=1 Tax=Streptococcus uberis TaxID=1349 RepID=UPI000620335B|nr:hypothetical protein [Streptococcus uberis]QBX21976.1 hypothetical protein Javan623_0029 [Streptococcus phage Javan623]QBX22031.1 hypothetical protein Javan629_0029 [Streptococcus phage Javan629]
MRTAFAREVPPRKPDIIKPIKELTITFKENSSLPEVILNGVNLNENGAGLVSVNLNWFTNTFGEKNIDDLFERNVSIEYFDKPGKEISLCKLSQSFKL